jgi:hypothetical protein
MCGVCVTLREAEFSPSGKSAMNDAEALRAVFRFHEESQKRCADAVKHFAVTADAILWQRLQRPDVLLFTRWAEKAGMKDYLLRVLATHFWPDDAIVEDLRLADPMMLVPPPIALPSQVHLAEGTANSFNSYAGSHATIPHCTARYCSVLRCTALYYKYTLFDTVYTIRAPTVFNSMPCSTVLFTLYYSAPHCSRYTVPYCSMLAHLQERTPSLKLANLEGIQ